MTDRLIRITTALAVSAAAVFAAIISYQRAYELLRSHGRSGVTARLLPFTVDGLIWTASMFSGGRQAVARRGAAASCGELLQHISRVRRSLSLLIRSLARADPPHVQHLAWRRRVVDHGSTRTIREDARFVPVLTPRESMVVLDACRRNQPVPRLAAWSLGAGIVATVGANLAHGVGHGPVGVLVSAWPALALVGSFELLMMLICIGRGTRPGQAEPEPWHQVVPPLSSRPTESSGERGAPTVLAVPDGTRRMAISARPPDDPVVRDVCRTPRRHIDAVGHCVGC